MTVSARGNQSRDRRAISVRVGVACTFWPDELEAIAYVTGYDEPSRVDLKRWVSAVVRRAVEDAKRRMDEGDSSEERDVSF